MRKFVNINARSAFRVKQVAAALTLVVGVSSIVTNGKTQVALCGLTVLLGMYTDVAGKHAKAFNDELNSEFPQDALARLEDMHNNKLFIW